MQDNAPAPAPEAPVTPAPAAPEATPAEAPASEPIQANGGVTLTAEQAKQWEDFNRFAEGNGGFEKAFANFKQAISNPAPEPTPAPQQTVDLAPAQPAQPAQPREGQLTPQDIAMAQYFSSLATTEEYAPIAKDIASGAFIKEMQSMGIEPFDANGYINNDRIISFLDLKAKTVPPAPSTPEPNSTPMVEYYAIGGENITSLEDADAILAQSAQLRAQGQPLHPKYEEAVKFEREYYAKKK